MSQAESFRYRYFDLIMALFVAVLLISNIASAAKIVNLGLPVLTFDAGTLLFPVSYVFGDVLVEVYGYRHSRRVIWMGFFCAALLSLTLAVVRWLPGDPQWISQVGTEKFDAVLGTLASGRIIVASLVGYFMGEFSNAVIMARMKVLTQGRWLWLRTISSTLVGEGVDTLLFVCIAFLGVWSPALLVSIIVSNYVFKCGLEAAVTPLTYRVVNLLKRVEGVDVYDVHVDFNPFRLSV
ncbi:MAG: queuosine precursor transporter [Anaerolineae bacterium]|nr:queuosine precursor transporter [Anaerolineae bacterium]MDH7472738.1 queuosine precursor transporter [Anaerolineae bacterium]